MDKKVLSLLTFLCMSTRLFSSPIKSISFEGLKKTKDHVLQRDLKKFIGRDGDEETMHDLETELQKEGVFQEINIEKDEAEDGIEIKVTVKEKITFLPLPLVSASGGVVTVGMFLLDTNAFGLKHMAVVGGFYSKDEYRGIFLYSKPPAGHVPGVMLYGSAGKKHQLFKDMDDEECLEYYMKSANMGIAFTENITEIFQASISTNFGFKDFDQTELEKAKNNRYMEIKGQLKLSKSDWNGVFMSTKSAEMTYTCTAFTTYYCWHIFNPRVVLQQPVFIDDLRLIASVNGFHGKYIPYSAFVGNGGLGVSLFDSLFGTQHGIGASGGIEYAAFKTKIGLFSLYSVYQCAYAEDFDDEMKFNQGVGGGVQMFLKQIAIPAMNLCIVYNTTKHKWRGTFSLGISL